MSDSSQSHEMQPSRLPCPSLSPGACPNSCPLSWRCYLVYYEVKCRTVLTFFSVRTWNFKEFFLLQKASLGCASWSLDNEATACSCSTTNTILGETSEILIQQFHLTSKKTKTQRESFSFMSVI